MVVAPNAYLYVGLSITSILLNDYCKVVAPDDEKSLHVNIRLQGLIHLKYVSDIELFFFLIKFS